MGRRFINLTGRKFGKLTARRFIGRSNGRSIWLFDCECGQKTKAASGHVLHGHTRSCGCIQRATLRDRNTKHGLSQKDQRFYKTWKHMRYRCHNPRAKGYFHYGGRGISIVRRWDHFDMFFKDMYRAYRVHVQKYGIANTSLDRIDVNADYSPKNCRWATWKIQSQNRRPFGRENILKELYGTN